MNNLLIVLYLLNGRTVRNLMGLIMEAFSLRKAVRKFKQCNYVLYYIWVTSKMSHIY